MIKWQIKNIEKHGLNAYDKERGLTLKQGVSILENQLKYFEEKLK